MFYDYCLNIGQTGNNNKNQLFKKTKKRKKKQKFKKKKYKSKSKSKLKKILLTIIIFLFCCLLALLITVKYIFNDYYIILNRKPKIVAISYGNDLYKKQLQVNKKSAIEVGEVDEYYSYGPNDIDPVFREKNKDILNRKRGNGYWIWKSYFINKTMIEKLNYGDYLIYADAGILYMNSSHLLIDFMWAYKLTILEKSYTKRDAFILMDADTPYYYDTNQYMAGIQIYKKSNYTVKFIQEWLNYCQDERIITGIKNTLGHHNYPGFIENRHDQTALSILIKKYGEANSGSSNMTLDELKQRKHIIMPNIICMYRRKPFKDYDDIKEKCKKTIEYQNHIFS